MAKPRITVVTPTARLGGIDCLAWSLRNQTFKDFELIVVDELYKKRGRVVEEYLSSYGIDVKVLPSKPKKMRYKVASSLNVAIDHANGELIVVVEDYPILTNSNLLEQYWNLYQKFNNTFFTGPRHRVFWRSNIKDLEKVGEEELYISIFDKPLEEILRCVEFEITWVDPRVNLLGTESKFVGECCHLHVSNAAIPMKIVEDVGGFDEDYDGCHGMHDFDFEFRARVLGYKLYWCFECFSLEFDHRYIFRDYMPWEHGEEKLRNVKLFEEKKRRIMSGLESPRLNYVKRRVA